MLHCTDTCMSWLRYCSLLFITIRLVGMVREELSLADQFIRLKIHSSRNGGDDYSEEPVEAHHVEEAFVDSLLSGAKSHPQDVLLKLQKENLYKQEGEENWFMNQMRLLAHVLSLGILVQKLRTSRNWSRDEKMDSMEPKQINALHELRRCAGSHSEAARRRAAVSWSSVVRSGEIRLSRLLQVLLQLLSFDGSHHAARDDDARPVSDQKT